MTNMRSACPLCQEVFEDQHFLETHASTCDGPIHTENMALFKGEACLWQ